MPNKLSNKILWSIAGIILLVVIGIVVIKIVQNQSIYKIALTRPITVFGRSIEGVAVEGNCFIDLSVEGSRKSVLFNQCEDTLDATDLVTRKGELDSAIIHGSFCKSNINNLKGSGFLHTLTNKEDSSICYVFEIE